MLRKMIKKIVKIQDLKISLCEDIGDKNSGEINAKICESDLWEE